MSARFLTTALAVAFSAFLFALPVQAQQQFEVDGVADVPDVVGQDLQLTGALLAPAGPVTSPVPLDYANFEYTLVSTDLELTFPLPQVYAPGTFTIYEDPIVGGTSAVAGDLFSHEDGVPILSGTLGDVSRTPPPDEFSTGSASGEVEWTGGTRLDLIAPGDRSGWTFSAVITPIVGKQTAEFWALTLVPPAPITAAEPPYADITTRLLYDIGAMIAVTDSDNDGNLDVYIHRGVGESPDSGVLLRHLGDGVFESQGSLGDPAEDSSALAWIDWDQDGDRDLFVGVDENYFGSIPNQVFRNDGLGSFVELQLGLNGFAPNSTSTAAWADADGDGDLDVFLGNSTGSAQLRRNDMVGVQAIGFFDATPAPLSGLTSVQCAAWGDYDGTGSPDLFVGGSTGQSKLFRNDGQNSYVDVTPAGFAGLQEVLDVAWADFDRDLDLDLLVMHGTFPHTIFINDAGSFATTITYGVSGSTGAIAVADMDHDGDEDIVVNSFNTGLFLNDGAGNMAPSTDIDWSGMAGFPKGLALADIDGDSDLDVFATRTDGFGDIGFTRLLRNDTNEFVTGYSFELDGVISNKNAVGARIELVTESVGKVPETQVRYVQLGSHSSSGALAHFGVGEGRFPSSIVIDWPSGVRQAITENFTNPQVVVEDGGWVDVSNLPQSQPASPGGVGLVDFSGDGLVDIWGFEPGFPNSYLGRGFGDLTFSRLGSSSLMNDQQMAFGDYDNDGDLDCVNGNLVYENNFDNFISGISIPSSWPTFADVDNDGDLDILLSNGTLADNIGDGLFADISTAEWTAAGAAAATRILPADYDNDGDMDVFFPSPSAANVLLRNDGGNNWVDVTPVIMQEAFEVTTDGEWADYDNDGDLDLYLVNTGYSDDFLFVNDGNGGFSSLSLGVLESEDGTSVHWLDVDLDGDLDLWRINGIDTFLFRNDGGGSFQDVVTGALATGFSENLSQAAWGDPDNDGDLDVYMADDFNGNRLVRNDNVTSNHYLQVELRGIVSNRNGIGAQVLVTAGGTTQMRQVVGSNGEEQHSHFPTFGLGSAATVDTVEVRWPSGILQTLTNVPADQRLLVLETAPRDGYFDAITLDPNNGDLLQVNLDRPVTTAMGNIGIAPGRDGTITMDVAPDARSLYILQTGGFEDEYYNYFDTADLHLVDLVDMVLVSTTPVTAPNSVNPSYSGMAIDPITGKIYVSLTDASSGYYGNLGKLAILDPSTGVVKALGDINPDVGDPFALGFAAMAFSPEGVLVGTAAGKGGAGLYTINTNTLDATRLTGAINDADELAFLGDRLWGMSHFNSRGGRVGESDITGGILTELSSKSLKDRDFFRGLAVRTCVAADTPLQVFDVPADGGGTIALDWSAFVPPAGVIRYDILRVTNSCDMLDPATLAIASVGPGVTSYEDDTVPDYTGVFYGIRAITSGKVDVISATITAGPVFSSPNLVINEFAPSGGVPKRGPLQGKRIGEFVEIRNISPDPIDLTGYRISNGPGAPTPDEETLVGAVPGNGLFTVILAVIDLPDAGGTISLLPPTGSAPVDEVQYGTEGGAPTSPAGFTVSRVDGTDSDDPDSESFGVSDPTPDQQNIVAQPQLGASIVFNEIRYSGSGPGDQDYIELYNRQGTLAVLDQLVIGNGITAFDTLQTSVALGPGAIAAFMQGDPGSFQQDLIANLLYLFRIDDQGNLQTIDQLGWGGTSAPGLPPAPGDALVRVPDGAAVYQGGQGANWLDSGGDDVLIYGERTPGEANRDPRFVEFVVDASGAGDFTTVGAALNAANPGTRILIKPGQYTETLSLRDDVDLVGLGGDPSTVVIEGDPAATGGVITASGVGLRTTISGLTIRNSTTERGGAVGIFAARPVFRNVIFEKNLATVEGGAVVVDGGGEPTFDGCLFFDNVSQGDGGAISVRNGTLLMDNCVMARNEANGKGGAVYLAQSSATMSHCIVDRNTSYAFGGATIQNEGASVLMTFSMVTFDGAGRALSNTGGGTLTFSCGLLFGAPVPTDPGQQGLTLANLVEADPQYCQPLALNYAFGPQSPLTSQPSPCTEIIGIAGPPCAIIATSTPSVAPERTQLALPSPNPFNPATVVSFDLSREGKVDVNIYDLRGRLVSGLVRGEVLPAGTHAITWHGRDDRGQRVASGVYFVRLALDGQEEGPARRMVLLK